MRQVLNYLLSIIAGIIVGSLVNMSLVMTGMHLYPLDINNMLNESTILPFMFPFFAHALGTLVGAFVAAMIATNGKQLFAMIIGCWFLLGGSMMVYMYPSPTWFAVLDLTVAYLPMGYLGWKLASSFKA